MSSPVLRHCGFLLMLGAVLLTLAPSLAEARLGGRSSLGSRGTRTYEAPAPTATAPQGARPMERSMERPTTPNYAQPPLSQPYPQSSGFFGRGLFGGFGGGLLGGLLGAGLFGLLFGHGLFGGMGGIGSLFGLIIQIFLLYFVFKWVWSWFGPNRRYAGAPMQGSSAFATSAFGGSPVGGFGATPMQSAPKALDLSADDFARFEVLLVDIQTAFGREDLDNVRTKVTPEMASYFAEQLADQARKGLVNIISNVRFLHGDLSEAWAEAQDEFATVSMRYELIDVMQERNSQRIVEGDPNHAEQVTEFWTFRRPLGSSPHDWRLSAIQQVN